MLAHGLWRMCADNMPAKLTRALGKGALGRAAHLVTMLEFPLKMGAEACEQARSPLTVTVTRSLTPTLTITLTLTLSLSLSPTRTLPLTRTRTRTRTRTPTPTPALEA